MKNRRLRVILTMATLALSVAGMTSSVRAQTAPTTDIPDALKISTNVTTAQIKPAIDAQFTKLAGSDPVAQAAAREWLINNVQPKNLAGGAAAPQFVAIFCKEINANVVKLANDPSMRIRLNAAIVLAGVAERGRDLALLPATLALLNDKSDAIVIWSMKAAGAILPVYLANAQLAANGQLLQVIPKTVKAHPTSGATADEAYGALTLDIFTKAVPPAVLTAVIPSVQETLEFRTKLYVDGIPDEPAADRLGAAFLANPNVWPLQNSVQQVQTMQIESDLISLAVQQAAANPSEKDKFFSVIKSAGSAIDVMGSTNQAVKDAAKNFKEIQRTYNPENLAKQLPVLLVAIKSVPAFANITNPPNIAPKKPAPPAAN